jgi:hypothetical protein
MREFGATAIATAALLLITACSADGTVAPGEGLAPTPTSNFNTERNLDARPGHTEFQTEVHL